MLCDDILINHIFPRLISMPLEPLFLDTLSNINLQAVQCYRECRHLRVVNKQFWSAFQELRKKVASETLDWKKLEDEIADPFKITLLKLYFFHIEPSHHPTLSDEIKMNVFRRICLSNDFDKPFGALGWIKLLICVGQQYQINVIKEKNHTDHTPLFLICQQLSRSGNSDRSHDLESLLDLFLSAESSPKDALYRVEAILDCWQTWPCFSKNNQCPLDYLDITTIAPSTLKILIKYGMGVNDKNIQGENLLDLLILECLDKGEASEDLIEKMQILLNHGAIVSERAKVEFKNLTPNGNTIKLLKLFAPRDKGD